MASRGAHAQAPGTHAEGAALAAPSAERAKQLFESGFRLAQQGDYEAAAAAFEQAYASSPNASVLFNLGQAYATAGDPVRAHDAFEKYLVDTRDERIDPKREQLVRQAMAVAQGRIGRLHIEVRPPDALLEVDGRSIGVAPLTQGVRLKIGSHAVVARHADFQPKIVNVVVQPRSEERLVIELEPPPRVAAPGYLIVRCGTPDLELSLSGKRVGKTPFASPIAVSPGRYEAVLSRAGYVSESSGLEIESGGARWLACRAEPDELSATRRVTVRLDESLQKTGTQVYIDGRLRPESVISLPSGKHDVEVRMPRFETWSRQLELEPGATHQLSPHLTPAEEYRAESIAERQRQLFWSGIALGTGVALGSAAVALGVHTEAKHDRWQAEREALDAERLATEEVTSRLRANYEEAMEIQRLEYFTVTAGVLGLACLGASALFWFTAEEVPAGEPSVAATPLGRFVYRATF